jgi:hypothetical protein
MGDMEEEGRKGREVVVSPFIMYHLSRTQEGRVLTRTRLSPSTGGSHDVPSLQLKTKNVSFPRIRSQKLTKRSAEVGERQRRETGKREG